MLDIRRSAGSDSLQRSLTEAAHCCGGPAERTTCPEVHALVHGSPEPRARWVRRSCHVVGGCLLWLFVYPVVWNLFVLVWLLGRPHRADRPRGRSRRGRIARCWR